ncbi:ectoine synthase [Saccharothrix sp. S26]|uniref:ectoine synthase n=1 Tax=Saccharothrix sp. S26 TaxID=2907215 RepID=UPI001F1D7ED6|nr:ectoine synthase [Saccharothrix sp. S26]MCE6995240.1 ectoine synthase [Saccharothrix sp. S26]
MIVRTLDQISGTERDVVAATWRSRRLVLAGDGVGFSLHETVMYAGTETAMWYTNHVEAVLCVEGEGELVDGESGDRHPLRPGTMYLLDGHERHTVRATTQLRMVCVFTPALTGREVHDDKGSYPPAASDDDR